MRTEDRYKERAVRLRKTTDRKPVNLQTKHIECDILEENQKML